MRSCWVSCYFLPVAREKLSHAKLLRLEDIRVIRVPGRNGVADCKKKGKGKGNKVK